MRVTIDAVSTLMRSAGVKNYTYYWLKHLRLQAQPDEEIRAFPLLSHLNGLNHESSQLPLHATVPRLGLVGGINRFGPRLLDLVVGKTDIFHSSNQIHHSPRRSRLTATIHDLTSLLMPEVHTTGNVRVDRVFFERLVRSAHALIAVSENTRQDAIRLLGIAPERITTIYSGVPEEYFDAAPRRRPKPYVLYVGTIEPRKNLDTLLDAWESLRRELRGEFELVVAGPMGWASPLTRKKIRARATYLGYVPEQDLPGLFAGAAAFVYPSLYEGFGFPVVQAMAAGTPVVTSCTSCLPEVTGGSALLADPRSASEISTALTRVLESESLREELSARGRERSRLFRWEICARQSLEFFRRVGGE